MVRPTLARHTGATVIALLALCVGLPASSTHAAEASDEDAGAARAEPSVTVTDHETTAGGTDPETLALALVVVVLAMGSTCLVGGRRPRAAHDTHRDRRPTPTDR